VANHQSGILAAVMRSMVWGIGIALVVLAVLTAILTALGRINLDAAVAAFSLLVLLGAFLLGPSLVARMMFPGLARRERASRRPGAYGAVFYANAPRSLSKGLLGLGDMRVESGGVSIRIGDREGVRNIDWHEVSGVDVRRVGMPMNRREVLALVLGTKVICARLWDGDEELSPPRLRSLAKDLTALRASAVRL